MRSKDFEELRDFYNHRLALNYGDDSSKETPEYWDSAAERFAKSVHSAKGRAEAEEFLNQFIWEKGETVLDIACGPGTFAIPLALRGCKVVATDFSAEMLKQLKLQAEREKVPEIECIKSRWLESNLQVQFDTVICLNGLGVASTDAEHKARLGECLEKIYRLTRKRIILLIPHADSHLDDEMRRILGEYEIPMERLRIAMIYYAMVDHGMLPSIQIIQRPFKWVFSSLDEACDVLFKKSGIKEVCTTSRERFKKYIEKIMKPEENNNFSLTYNTKQALFIVNKTF